jgi:predicted metal-dependent hydrolase
MRLSLLKECIKLTLSEWTFDRAGYADAKATLSRQSPPSKEEAQAALEKKRKEEEKKPPSREEKSGDPAPLPKREKSVEIQFDEKQAERPAPKQDKRDPSKDKAALEQVTQKVLDELEKFHNDKKSVPKARKFADKSFASDLQNYLKRELGSKDMQKLTTRDVEYLVKQADYQFNRYIQGKVSSK